MEKFLGIDVGGTNVKCGAVTSDGALLHKNKYKTAELVQTGNFIEAFLEVIAKELAAEPEIKKVGIGVPGTISKDRTTFLEMANIPAMNGVKIGPMLAKKFPDVVFHIENDANAAALGELHFGEGKLPDTYLFVTLGTGVGGACIIDGQIFKGGDGNGLEIGHIMAGNGLTVEANIGKKGILGLALTTLEGYEGKSVLSSYKNIDPKKVVKAAHKDDELALGVFEQVGKILGQCVISTVRILDIKTIVIGGGVSETFQYVEKSMWKQIEKHLTSYYTNTLDIRLATLRNEAGIVGAASLCFID